MPIHSRSKSDLRVSGYRLTFALLLAASPALTSSSHASVWESENWAATGMLGGKTGYDSNVTLSNEGDGAYFLQASPSVELLRRNSTTDIRFGGVFTWTEYIDSDEPAQDDLRLRARYAYPIAENTLPTYVADASWAKTSEPNQYLGRRVEYTLVAVTAEGYLPLTGKLGLRGNLDFSSSR